MSKIGPVDNPLIKMPAVKKISYLHVHVHLPMLLALNAFLLQTANPASASPAQANLPAEQASSPAGTDMAAENASVNASANASENGADYDSYPRVTGMEKVILGQTYATDTLPNRLSRLETKAFGKPAENLDLSSRTDNLQDYVEKKLHKNVLPENPQASAAAQEQGQDPGSQQAGHKASFLSKAATALTGIPFDGSAAQNPGYFMPGFGPFAGVRVRQRSAAQEQPAESPDEARMHQFDDVINAPTPPPANTRALAKVGWCEKQVFGQVFYSKHLMERLDALNNQLHVAPGKQGSDLLDDIDKLVTAAAKPARGI